MDVRSQASAVVLLTIAGGTQGKLSSLDGRSLSADTFPMGVSEELRALADVVDRLAVKFPGMSREHIEDVVQQEHSLLDAGRVRAFIPVLVEHAARDRLSG